LSQQDKSEPLKCPLDSFGGQVAVKNVIQLFKKNIKSISALPTSICFGNDTSVEDLISHHACWHKSCHLKYSSSKLAKTKES